MFAYQDAHDPVEVAFTDRHGGVSGGPFASLNLASSPGDSPESVRRNLGIVATAFARGGRPTSGSAAPAASARVFPMRQVHGAEVVVVDEPALAADTAPVADGLVTALAGVVLLVRVADCVPVLLADLAAGVVGAAHAGRQGLVAGVVPNTVARMRALGADKIRAWVGPHVCGACYEVPEPMRREVTAVVPEAWAETSWGTPSVDVGAGVAAQLTATGVAHADLVRVPRCTVEDDDLFSYRRQGPASGRLGALVWVRP